MVKILKRKKSLIPSPESVTAYILKKIGGYRQARKSGKKVRLRDVIFNEMMK